MKKCVDGNYIEMTVEEIAALGEDKAEQTLEERLAALEMLVQKGEMSDGDFAHA